MFQNPGSTSESCYLICEIGVNHEGKIDLAKKMIDEIATAGASAAKFQTYKAEKLAAAVSPSYWDTDKEPSRSQRELFKKYDVFERADYIELAAYCKSKKIDFLSTPFDEDCLEWLIPLMPFVKIASADLTNNMLLDAVSAYGKPVVLSTGASTYAEICDAISVLKGNGIGEIALLHCVLNYPTPLENASLSRISWLRESFRSMGVSEIGYSDHVVSGWANNDQIIAAYSMGCRLIEKHYTYDKSMPGNDHYHAMDFADLCSLVSRLSDLGTMLRGFDEKSFIDSQVSAIQNARRSLFYKQDMLAGDAISRDCLVAKRPGSGVSPLNYKKIIGRRLLKSVKKDEKLEMKDLSED